MGGGCQRRFEADSMDPTGEAGFHAAAIGSDSSGVPANQMLAASTSEYQERTMPDAGGAKGGGGIGEMKSKINKKMGEVKGRMDDVKDRMEDAVGNIQATNLKGAVILSKMSAQSGNQLIARFLHMSLSSSKSRRERSSEATAQLAQALLVNHSGPALDPVYSAVAHIGAKAGLHIFNTTLQTIFLFVRHQQLMVVRLAQATGHGALTVLRSTLSLPEGYVEQHSKRCYSLMVKLITGTLLLGALCVFNHFATRDVWYGVAFGCIVSLWFTFSYFASRRRRATQAYFLAADWTQGGPLQQLLDHLGIAAEDNVAGDGNIVHQGVGWLNALLSALWPKLAQHVGKFLLASSNELMLHFKPSFLSHLGVTRCELGNLPIDIRRLKINTLNSKEIDFEVAATWEGQVAIDLIMDVPGARFETDVRKLQFKGEFRIVAGPLVPVFPGFAAFRVSLTKPPQLDFQVNIKTRLSPPAVVSWLKRFIRETIDDLLLWPNRLVVPLLPEDHPRVGPYIDSLLMTVKGIVKIKVLGAEDLPNEDTCLGVTHRCSDPYVVMDTSRAEFSITKTKHNTQFPVWNETHYLRVFELNRPLHIEVWDADVADSDDLLGRCSVNLLDLKTGTMADRWYPLGRHAFHDVEGTGAGFGRVRLGIKWWPMQHLTCNLGTGWIDTSAEGFDPKKIGQVQRGCVLVQLIKCSGLPCENKRICFQADGCIEGVKSSSLMIEAADGAPKFFYNANFYDVPVTSKLVLKVFAMGGSGKTRHLLGLINLPLSFPAMSEHGILRGDYALSGAQASVATIQVQWLPLDCNELPFPPITYDDRGYLSIHLDSARDLINTDRVGLSDPFATFKVGLHKQLSSCKDDTLNPVWHEDFDFPDVSTSDILHVHLKDKDRLKSDNLGSVYLPVVDIVTHCLANPAGCWTSEWPLAGVASGSVKLTLYWDAGKSATQSIALDDRVRQLHKQLCLAPLDQEDTFLPKVLALPEWWLNTDVTWAEAKWLEYDAVCPNCQKALPSARPKRTQYITPFGTKDAASSKSSESASEATCRCHLAGSGTLLSAQEAGVEKLQWDLLVVLHDMRIVGDGSGTDTVSQLPKQRVTVRMSVEGAHHKSSRKDGNFKWKEGFIWHQVGLNSDAVVLISVLAAGLQGEESHLGDLALPLAAVRLAPSRMLSGVFALKTAQGQSSGNFGLSLELAYVQHSMMSQQSLRVTIASAKPVEAVTLHVLLESAEGLRAADANGSSDPFCTLKSGANRFVSSIKKKTLNPVWNEAFTFDGLSRHSSLHINVWDKDRVKSDFLGRVDIPVSTVLSGTTKQKRQSFPLRGEHATGMLTLSLQWSAHTIAHSPRRAYHGDKDRPGLSGLGMDIDTASDESLGSGTLKILVRSGRDLLPMDSNGLSDPYCTLKVKKQRQVTKVKSRNLNPQWGEMFTFESVEAGDVLRINVWDKDYVTKDHMGALELPLSRVAHAHGQVVDDEWELTLDGEPAGYLALSMTWTPGAVSRTAPDAQATRQSRLPSPNTLDYRSPAEASGNDPGLVTFGNPTCDPMDGKRISALKALTVDETVSASPSQSSATPPVTSVSNPPAPEDSSRASHGSTVSDSSLNQVPGKVLAVSTIALDRLHRTVDGPLYVALKLGQERRATLATSAYSSSDTVGPQVVWHPGITIPCEGDISRLYLRARVYRRYGPMKLKSKFGEVQIALSKLFNDSSSTVSGSWPLSGGTGMVDMTLSLRRP